MLSRGRLPNLARLRDRGGYSRVATTTPAQTPVAWSTFATGVNPGGHGIFDFLRRDPSTYLPDLGLNRYEQTRAFLPPQAVNLRRGTPVWEILSDAGVESAIIRCPCTYPPAAFRGRLLSGMGVPDLRLGIGTSTFYTTADHVARGDSEQVVRLAGEGGEFRTHLVGPRDPRTRGDVTEAITLRIDASAHCARILSRGRPRTLELREGLWSDWLRLRFRSGPLQSTSGMVRFLLVGSGSPVELHASPVNFDPVAPAFPISHPWEYAAELAAQLGPFYTTGMVEDHAGLTNERFGEDAFLAQCEHVMRERERMLMLELQRVRNGLVFCLFDTPDRVQHMFWRFGEPEHPANRRRPDERARYGHVIEEHYERCDGVVGRVLDACGDDTLVMVLSDHGFRSFQRGVHLNAWLHANGYLALKAGVQPGPEAGDFLRQVDWGRTRAYALGLGSVYVNVRGRDAEGIVARDEADRVGDEVARRITGLVDPERGVVAVRGAHTRGQLYSGPFADESPDVVVDFAEGYRVSWDTALGSVPAVVFEDNLRKWGGDHIIDPTLVPGVLFMSRSFREGSASLLDLAPTILDALSVPLTATLEGRSLLVA